MRARRVGAGQRITLATSFATALAVLGGSATAASAPPDPTLGQARLTGQFALAGRVTVATRIYGERVGQNVARTWSFVPACPAGPCGRIMLRRERARGSDTLTLNRRSPGFYAGSGSFYVPVKCGGRRYARGEIASFRITVTVTKALPNPAHELVATRISATYTNPSRRNLTPCVAFPGYDAATYHGHVIIVSSPSGGGGV